MHPPSRTGDCPAVIQTAAATELLLIEADALMAHSFHAPLKWWPELPSGHHLRTPRHQALRDQHVLAVPAWHCLKKDPRNSEAH